MITVSERLSVTHSPDIVWGVLSDPAQVVACLEGSELGEYHEDGSFDARIAVRFAAIRVGFAARAKLDLDHEGQAGRLEASGGDARGSTRVSGHMDYAIVPDADGCAVTIEGAADIKGPLASLVTTGATVVVNRMMQSFGARLAERCAELDPDHDAAAAAAATAGDAGGGWLGRVLDRGARKES